MVSPITFATAILAAVAHLTLPVSAAPTTDRPVRRDGNQLPGTGYGTFYKGSGCKKDPSVAFAFNNAGCLANELGRGSLYVQPGAADTGFGRTISMVFSPGKECGCQNHCEAVAHNGGSDYCWEFGDKPVAQSFRFIEQACGGNNC
ncbi:hypothetical protein ANO11243_017730 [Dothideomycetidae sp. 11243]|nr:hypothetical protein ANO11243_017730 [fungal sp. No.11243]